MHKYCPMRHREEASASLDVSSPTLDLRLVQVPLLGPPRLALETGQGPSMCSDDAMVNCRGVAA